ncbi:MAG: extracellular solute-binding protein [Caldilineaceae bacterium]|nr:extracellular solute-binding protein [Caldilineaceae bacterium]
MQSTVDRRFSRRQFLQLTGIGATAAALVACVPAAPAPGQSAGAGSTEGITLSHWQHHSASRAAAVEAFKAQFEETHDDVTIDFQSIPWADYWGKLASGIAAGAGSAPDIFQIPMGLVEEYIAGGNVIPVSELVISSADIEKDYLPWTVQRGKQGNEYYGLPLDVQTLVVYRNNALFEEAGLDPTAPFVDHTDLFDQALKLTKKTDGLADQIGFDTSYYSAFQTVLFQQYLQREQDGKAWVDPSTNQLVWMDYPEILETFKWFCQLSAEVDDDAFLKGQARFALGKAGMELTHPVNRGSLKTQAPDLAYTIVPFAPRSVEQPLYTGGSHWMWVVGKWVPDAELAWQWVHSCTNKEAQIIWNDVGGDLPSFTELQSDPVFRPDANANVCMDSLGYASPWEWVGWAEWVKEFGDGRDRVVIGGETAEASFETMVTNLNKVIETHTVNA